VLAASASAQTEDMPHMRMTVRTAPVAGDSARAAAVAAAARASLAPYADYHRALADGFRIFAPNVRQRVYHFSSWRRAALAAVHFDPAQPTSLLYERTGDSTYRLVGAMYTAPRRSSLAELNARVPVSVAQWHLHTNWCLPPRDSAGNRLRERGSDGRPLFGAQGSITTEAACRAAGGRFHPQLFGWMVHVHPLASDPAELWGPEDMSHMSGMSESR
jgi:hypothetical protein